MNSVKNNIPKILVYSRLALAWLILIVALTNAGQSAMMICVMLVVGLLTDISDGIIARLLGVSTVHLRQLDTTIDRIFWLSGLMSSMILYPSFFATHLLGITILLLLELLAWIVGRMKFRNNISFHSILSKFWAIAILITFVDLLTDGEAAFSYQFTFWYGILAQLDIVLIVFLLPAFQCDIPSAWHALRIRNGKTIRRMKLFNG